MGITFGDSQNRAVTHINRYQDAFAFVRGNGAFTQNSFVNVNVIVYCMKTFTGTDTRPLQQNFSDCFTILFGKFLTVRQIVQIFMKKFSVNEYTIDESPMAYKSLDDIIDVIDETVDIVEIMKPVYNFKAG